MHPSILLCGLLHAQDPFTPAHVADGKPATLLVLENAARSGRRPLAVDRVEHRRASAPLPVPATGSSWFDSEPLTWKLVAGSDGSFPLRAGSYAFTQVEADADSVVILEASGHRSLWADDQPRIGDVYQLGFVRVPIRLRQGRNDLWFRAGRGNLTVRWSTPPAPLSFSAHDRTLPHLLRGETGLSWGAVVVLNATDARQEGVEVVATLGCGTPVTTALHNLEPLEVRKVAFQFSTSDPEHPDPRLHLELLVAGSSTHSMDTTLGAATPEGHHRRTFRSTVDGSVQYFATVPRDAPAGSPAGALILTLHGAGVEADGQAACYARKDWADVVAPTNRRPYGFDWEDWGRLDALEVLDLAIERYRPDPTRIYLTGHSMGGHGTWQIGAHCAPRFAAIAPSAGWPDFESYGNSPRLDPADPVEAVFARAANASRTGLLQDNYQELGVYVLHGDADDNVPVDLARGMRTELARFHPNFAYYERTGAGHWWGNECVDWPPLMTFLRANQRPPVSRRDRIMFKTVNPAVFSRSGWVEIAGTARALEVASVEARRLAPDAIEIKTANVSRLKVHVGELGVPGTRLRAVIDDQEWPNLHVASSPLLVLERDSDSYWRPRPDSPARCKNERRSGPFKEALQHGLLLVYGTAGTLGENAWALGKARYDAETFWYRGNASPELIADFEYDKDRFKDRGIVLYGHADMHRQYAALLHSCPVTVRRGSITVGERRFEGEGFAALLCYPREDSDQALVALVAGTGEAGLRATDQLPYFVSGVHYPDWTVLHADAWRDDLRGVRAAGFFDAEWLLDSDDSVFRE